MDSELTISPCDGNWPDEFRLEGSTIDSIFDSCTVVIEHIGSTSVPQLGAKPIIDMMVGVDNLVLVERRIHRLTESGYPYVPEYEAELPERRYFRKPGRHLHCVLIGSSFWIDRRLFRDYLRAHPNDAAEYFSLRQLLAKKHSRNHRAYTEGKSSLIAKILDRARDCTGMSRGNALDRRR